MPHENIGSRDTALKPCCLNLTPSGRVVDREAACGRFVSSNFADVLEKFTTIGAHTHTHTHTHIHCANNVLARVLTTHLWEYLCELSSRKVIAIHLDTFIVFLYRVIYISLPHRGSSLVAPLPLPLRSFNHVCSRSADDDQRRADASSAARVRKGRFFGTGEKRR